MKLNYDLYSSLILLDTKPLLDTTTFLTVIFSFIFLFLLVLLWALKIDNNELKKDVDRLRTYVPNKFQNFKKEHDLIIEPLARYQAEVLRLKKKYNNLCDELTAEIFITDVQKKDFGKLYAKSKDRERLDNLNGLQNEKKKYKTRRGTASTGKKPRSK
jgi:hypothetical protein